MPADYDAIATTYQLSKALPVNIMLTSFNNQILGSVAGLNILDLACGTGYYSFPFLEKGAASVVGIDISPGMIEQADIALAAKPEYSHRCKFLVGDCTDENMLESLGLEKGKWDLVHGTWLLNYAADRTQLLAMWRNVASALKPGGRFVGVIPNILDQTFDLDRPFDWDTRCKYGSICRALVEVEHGWKSRVTFPSAGVEFDNYFLNKDGLYESCAIEAGMSDVKFEVPVVSEALEQSFGVGFWDDYKKRPGELVCTAVKPREIT
jgi:SAM-dependent methyltransferase